MNNAKGRYMLVVSLWVREDKVAAFEDFEKRLSKLLARHGGRIEYAIRPVSAATDVNTPFEIHIVSFAEQEGYAQYRADPEVQMLRSEREKIIAKTTVVEGYALQ
jgi:hypothetical protein